MKKTLLALTAAAALLLALADGASADGSDVGATGALTLTLVDAGGVPVSGACFELYVATGVTYGVLVDTFCNTSGESVRTLPEGAYVLREVQPPHLLLPPSGFAESHVYRKAPDAHFSISALLPTQVTIEHEPGAAIAVHATLPDGSDATASCFAARGAGASDDPAGAGRVLDEACSGTGAGATLFVGSGEHVVSQVTGPAGYALAADARVTVAVDATVTLELAMRAAPTLRIEQRASDGRLVSGGCYAIDAVADDGAATFVRYVCDEHDDARDGVVVADALAPARYRLQEEVAPDGFKPTTDDGLVVVGRADVTVARLHERLPYVQVKTTNAVTGAAVGGSCWRVRFPGDREGIVAEACDVDDGANDGLTRLTTVPAGDWELLHTIAPGGYARVGAPAPFTLADDDLELAFALAGPSAPPSDPPVSIEPPAITGSALVGSPQQAIAGWWGGRQPIVLAYQWERCDEEGAACTAVAGATGDVYVPTGADHHATLRVAVTATNADGQTVARSAATPPLLAPPRNAVAPRIVGVADPLLPGRTLSGQPGTWVGAPPLAHAAQWLRCDATGEACVEIAGASGWTYTVHLSDLERTLRLRVTASNVDGAVTASSDATPAVVASAPLDLTPPAISGGRDLRPGLDLLGTPGTWVGTQPIAYTPQWLRCDPTGVTCLEVAEATEWSYRVTRADLHHVLRLRVTATNAGGASVALSAPTGTLESAPPRNVVPPFLTGIAVPGQPLKGFAGGWVGAQPIQLEPQWLRCDHFGGACDAVDGAASWTYVTSLADRGHTIRLAVSATNADGTSTARSGYSGIVPGSVPGPTNLAAPVISADTAELRVGTRLGGRQGTWTGTPPIAYAPQWLRCDASGELCAAVPGAVAWSYVLTLSDVGYTIRLAVTATDSAGSVTARSLPTAFLPPLPPVNLDPPSVSGDGYVGGRLRGHQGTWTGGRPMTFAPRWLRCTSAGDACLPIAGATGWTYVLTSADAEDTIRFEVTAANAYGRTVALTWPLWVG